MRARYLGIALLVIAAVAAVAAKRVLYTPAHPLAAPISAPQTQSYLIALGVADVAGAVYDGSITATGGTIVSLTGWRFYGTDSISGHRLGTWSWKATLRTTPSYSPPGPVQETGVIVTIAAPSGPVTFNVTTTQQGSFSFASTDVPFGVNQVFLAKLDGSLQGACHANGFAAAVDHLQRGRRLPVHGAVGRRRLPGVHGVYSRRPLPSRRASATTTTITNFAPFSRPVGGEQVLLMHYSKSQRTWTGPYRGHRHQRGFDANRGGHRRPGPRLDLLFDAAQRELRSLRPQRARRMERCRRKSA